MLIDELQKIPGIGLQKAEMLISKGVKSINDLLKYKNLLSDETQLSLKYPPTRLFSWEIANDIIEKLPNYFIGVGSYRRRKSCINDIDLLTTESVTKAVDAVKSCLNIVGEYASGEQKHSFIVKYMNKNGKEMFIRMDLFFTNEEEKPFALMHYTGSKLFNIKTRAHAKYRGYKLSQHGLFKNGNKIPLKNEAEILYYINLEYKTPQQRE